MSVAETSLPQDAKQMPGLRPAIPKLGGDDDFTKRSVTVTAARGMITEGTAAAAAATATTKATAAGAATTAAAAAKATASTACNADHKQQQQQQQQPLQLDEVMQRHRLVFRARHIETLISVVFARQLRELGQHLQLRAHAMVRQFHTTLTEQAAFDEHARAAVDKSQLFVSAAGAAIVDVASLASMERRFLAAFGRVGGDPERWRRLQQTVDYGKLRLDELAEHHRVLADTVRDMKQINFALQLELQAALTNVFQYYVTNAGLLLENGVVAMLEKIFRATCIDLVNVVDRTFRLIKDVIMADDPISDHAPLEESSLNIVLSLSDVDNLLELVAANEGTHD